MSTTLDKIRARSHVAFVDDERDLGNSIIVTLREGFDFADEPGCGVQGFDTVKDCERATRSARVIVKGVI